MGCSCGESPYNMTKNASVYGPGVREKRLLGYGEEPLRTPKYSGVTYR
ncbi:MAG: hypothetical protein ACE5J7_01580 [Candidatus Aenigmatarchaeota archaeon]